MRIADDIWSFSKWQAGTRGTVDTSHSSKLKMNGKPTMLSLVEGGGLGAKGHRKRRSLARTASTLKACLEGSANGGVTSLHQVEAGDSMPLPHVPTATPKTLGRTFHPCKRMRWHAKDR
jgi:hypothetical protein